jgi:hypothetical protein
MWFAVQASCAVLGPILNISRSDATNTSRRSPTFVDLRVPSAIFAYIVVRPRPLAWQASFTVQATRSANGRLAFAFIRFNP